MGAHAIGVEPDVLISIEYDILRLTEVDRVGLNPAESRGNRRDVASDEIVDSVVNSRVFFVYSGDLFHVKICGKIYGRLVH